MGTQFFWFFDLMVVIITIATIIKCAHKGFVASLFSALSVLVAFLAAFYVSDIVSDTIYKQYVSEPLTASINDYIDETLDNTLVDSLENVDMTKIKINSRYIDAYNLEPDTAGNITIDMSNTDLTETGLQYVDLSKFGFNEETDYANLNIGTVQITQSELKDASIYTLMLAHVLSSRTTGAEIFDTIGDIINEITEELPDNVAETISKLSLSSNSINYDVVKYVLTAEQTDYGSAILDGLLKSIIIIPIRALIFLILFVIIMLVLGIVIKVCKLVNKIPVIGSVNILLGALLGVVETILFLLLISIFVQIIVLLSGDTLIFMNSMTIDETFIFKHIYYFDFINLLV